MICDVHAHYIPQAFSDFMGDRFSPRVGVPTRTGIARHPVSDSQADIQGRLELMDAAGVETQILSPHHPPYLPDEAECVQALHLLNDGYADLARRYPGRIASYVMLPLPHIDASLREMERGLDQLGCVGVNMNISCLGRSIAETQIRTDLCRDEPARRGPLRASGGNRDLLAVHRRLQLSGGGRHLARGRDLCLAYDRQADPAPLSEH